MSDITTWGQAADDYWHVVLEVKGEPYTEFRNCAVGCGKEVPLKTNTLEDYVSKKKGKLCPGCVAHLLGADPTPIKLQPGDQPFPPFRRGSTALVKVKPKRQFYRTVIEIEVLSEEPIEFDTLEEINYAIINGDCSGQWDTTTSNEVIDGPTMARLLCEHESDPSFFGLDYDGNELDEDDGNAEDK